MFTEFALYETLDFLGLSSCFSHSVSVVGPFLFLFLAGFKIQSGRIKYHGIDVLLGMEYLISLLPARFSDSIGGDSPSKFYNC